MATINAVNTTLSGQSGSGAFAGTNGPTFTSPILGTPASGILSSCTGYAATALTGLGTGVGTALGQNVSGSGSIALTTSPSFTTPTIGAATATSITFSNYATGGIVGTSTDDAAAAGYVGQRLASNNTGGSAMTSTVALNIANITLTAGDWEVYAMGTFGPTGNPTVIVVGLSTTSATLGGTNTFNVIQGAVLANTNAMCAPTQTFSVSGSTTVYLVLQATFTATCTGFGEIHARRIR